MRARAAPTATAFPTRTSSRRRLRTRSPPASRASSTRRSHAGRSRISVRRRAERSPGSSNASRSACAELTNHKEAVMASTWAENNSGQRAEAERLEFDRLAIDIMRAQLKARKATGAAAVDRAFHAKALVAVDQATVTFRSDLPKGLAIGFAKPGASYRAIIRISNAANHAGPDYRPDLRGIAVRIVVSADEQHDLLATNYPVSHARNARQFVRFAVATAGGRMSRVLGIVGLMFSLGPFETIRMLRNIAAGRRRVVRSVALETYWSRGAMKWGDEAVRFLIRPVASAVPAPDPALKDPEYLAKEATLRLARGDIAFDLCIQRFVEEKVTPVEDTAVEWQESVSPPEPVATITIAKADVGPAAALACSRAVEGLSFNPWNTTDDFRPLGNLNRARKVAYDASAAHRLAMRWHADPLVRNRVLSAIARVFFRGVNRLVEWHKLPLRGSLLNLDIFRFVLRRDHLIDTNAPAAATRARAQLRRPRQRYVGARYGCGRSGFRPQHEARLPARPLRHAQPDHSERDAAQ